MRVFRNFLCRSLSDPEVVVVFGQAGYYSDWCWACDQKWSVSLRTSILLGSFSRCNIVKISSIGRISCPAFRMSYMMLSMWWQLVVFITSIASRALIHLGSFSNFKIVMFSSVDRISCPAFSMFSEKVDFPFEVSKSFLCSWNIILKFFFVLPV